MARRASRRRRRPVPNPAPRTPSRPSRTTTSCRACGDELDEDPGGRGREDRRGPHASRRAQPAPPPGPVGGPQPVRGGQRPSHDRPVADAVRNFRRVPRPSGRSRRTSTSARSRRSSSPTARPGWVGFTLRFWYCRAPGGKSRLRGIFEWCDGESYHRYSGWMRMMSQAVLYDAGEDDVSVRDLHRILKDVVVQWYAAHLERTPRGVRRAPEGEVPEGRVLRQGIVPLSRRGAAERRRRRAPEG